MLGLHINLMHDIVEYHTFLHKIIIVLTQSIIHYMDIKLSNFISWYD